MYKKIIASFLDLVVTNNLNQQRTIYNIMYNLAENELSTVNFRKVSGVKKIPVPHTQQMLVYHSTWEMVVLAQTTYSRCCDQSITSHKNILVKIHCEIFNQLIVYIILDTRTVTNGKNMSIYIKKYDNFPSIKSTIFNIHRFKSKKVVIEWTTNTFLSGSQKPNNILLLATKKKKGLWSKLTFTLLCEWRYQKIPGINLNPVRNYTKYYLQVEPVYNREFSNHFIILNHNRIQIKKSKPELINDNAIPNFFRVRLMHIKVSQVSITIIKSQHSALEVSEVNMVKFVCLAPVWFCRCH
ncbi:hypothetical protein AGLY_008159 [Aphis glycines]|uniref:Uncharacterized protein n=1 Tax=Aphis glycines TaxID=307491 RepID=A0A6G0TLL5_APHGL|nr:hypothetical protein AGLY_008159 [Aphis glycines]